MNILISQQGNQLLAQFQEYSDREARAAKRQANQILKAAWDAIIESTTTKQYFKWHNNYFKGDLNYRHMATSMKASTKSKVLIVKCEALLALLTEAGY